MTAEKYYNPIFPETDFHISQCSSCGQHLQFNYRSKDGTLEEKEHVGYFHRCSTLKGSPFRLHDLLLIEVV